MDDYGLRRQIYHADLEPLIARRLRRLFELASLKKGGYNAGRKKFQFEFQKIASKREPCKLVYKWPSESNLSNGEVLRLKAAIKREKNGACSDCSERKQARRKSSYMNI